MNQQQAARFKQDQKIEIKNLNNSRLTFLNQDSIHTNTCLSTITELGRKLQMITKTFINTTKTT